MGPESHKFINGNFVLNDMTLTSQERGNLEGLIDRQQKIAKAGYGALGRSKFGSKREYMSYVSGMIIGVFTVTYAQEHEDMDIDTQDKVLPIVVRRVWEFDL